MLQHEIYLASKPSLSIDIAFAKCHLVVSIDIKYNSAILFAPVGKLFGNAVKQTG